MPDLDKLNELFDAAVALPEPERAAFIEHETAGDAGLRSSLEKLLARDANRETMLDMGLEALVDALIVEEPDLERVGPYRLVSEVGRGGMGTVFLAEREDGQFEQRVAVKLVKRGMDSDEVLRRFRAERQILARLEHPNIGRLYDGGIAEDGRPYLAMEFVEGSRITDFADAKRLTLQQRVDLFDPVAAAVRFAHLNMVVHRDLKPSNVLVADDGTVKLLDFGIAKLLGDDASDLTQAGSRVLTPAYAAPEQLDGSPITMAADVFSLGVLLHELLTGRRPQWRADDPLPPSTTVTLKTVPAPAGATDTEAATADVAQLSRLRRATPHQLSGALRGDLDAILVKALERDPARRYASVDAFIDDLARYRDGRPVLARQLTPTYRMSRLVRRHRLAVAVGAAVVGSLTIGLAVALQQRNAAVQAQAVAEATTAYLEGMFSSANPFGAGAADTLRVVDFLGQSTEAALADLNDQPLVRGRLLRTLGRATSSLADWERGQELWIASADAYREAGVDPPSGLTLDLGEAAMTMADWAAADSLMAAGLEAARREDDQPEVGRALTLQARSALRRTRMDDAARIIDEAVPLLESLGESEALAGAYISKGDIAWGRQDAAEAIRWVTAAADLFTRLRGPDDPQLGITLANLSMLQRGSGDPEGAQASIEEALRIFELRAPPGHPVRVSAEVTQANLLTRMGELEAADSLFAAAAAGVRPSDRQLLVNVLSNHAMNRRQAADTATAVALARRAVATGTEVFGEEPRMMDPLNFLGMMLDFEGDSVAAESSYQRALDVAGTAVPETNTGRMVAARGAARGLARRGEFAEAEGRLLRLLELTPPGGPPGSRQFGTRQATLRELIAVYRRWGRSEDAGHYAAMRADEAAGGN